MQDLFAGNGAAVGAFRSAISEARFSRYLGDSKGDELAAIRLYLWNTRLAQALYLSLQNWEIAFRNKLNNFLVWRYGAAWTYDSRAERELAGTEWRRLQEARERQERLRKVRQAPTGAIVADLSVGFWVGPLSKSYEAPFSWRYNLRRFVILNEPKLERRDAHHLCLAMYDLRNRVAHHEPIYDLPLDAYRADLDRLLEAMCSTMNAYTRAACTFEEVWNNPPA